MKHLVAAIAAALTVSATAHAAYPEKPVRLIVPFPAGGGVDIVARGLAPHLTERWGQQVIVDNRPGAGAMLGAELAAKSPPDGYTLLLADLALTTNPAYYRKSPPPDPLKAFTAVGMIAETPYILMVHPGFPATTIKDFVATAKAQPGRINVGSSGTGGGLHFTLELFKLKAGLDLNHIPYKGGGPAVADTLAGQIQGTFIGMGGSLQYVQSGRLRPLVVTSAQRSHALPAIPTMTELGYDVVVSNWYGVVAPAGTPAAIVRQLNAEMAAALKQNDTRERIVSTGLEPVAKTPAEFQNWIASEVLRWTRTVNDARIPTE